VSSVGGADKAFKEAVPFSIESWGANAARFSSNEMLPEYERQDPEILPQ
jgi:hypothetical protein